MALFDLPAMIGFILEHTKQEKLSYIGHSQGTSQMFYALSIDHFKLNEKINLFVALAPITKVGNDNEWHYTWFSKTVPKLLQITVSMGIFEFFGSNWDAVYSKLGYILNSKMKNAIKLQEVQITKYIHEGNATKCNLRPQSSTSAKSMAHFAKIRGIEKFIRFDYGPEVNQEKYNGSKEPPEIDIR